VSEDKFKDRRKYARANSSLRFTMEPLHDKLDQEQAIADIMSEPLIEPLIEAETQMDPAQTRLIATMSQMIEMIEDIGRKMDVLLAQAEGRPISVREVFHMPITNLSGGGFSFYTRRPVAVGDLFKVSIDLARMPLSRVRCVAEAKWVKPAVGMGKPGESNAPAIQEVGMEIQFIREADRERIIQSVFRIQREELRARKETKTK